MKNFVREVLASLLALVFGFWILYQVTLAGLGGPPLLTLPERAVLVLGPDLLVGDAGEQPSPAAMALEGAPRVLALRKVVAALDAAAERDAFVGLLLVDGGPRVSGWAQRFELRDALERFRDRGKHVWAQADSWDEASYLLGSVADEIAIGPLGWFEWNGFSAKRFYFGELLDRLGVRVQVVKVGRYKSAVEPFLRDDMSPEAREQLVAYLDDLQAEVEERVAEGRKDLDPSDFAALRLGDGFLTAEDAVAGGWVDRVATRGDLVGDLASFTGWDEDLDSFRQVSFLDWYDRSGWEPPLVRHEGTGPLVAVVYAEGEIVDGESKEGVGGETLARRLRALLHDDDVDAVVLRVDSPGGSAAASEVILRALVELDQAKPVVVSMGSLAASGGYWIACRARLVLAEPTTLTGSIGVFGLLPDVSPLLDELGIHVDGVASGPHADLLSPYRSRSEEELAQVQGFVDAIYELFLDHVSEGRGLPRERVAEIGGGRIWSGVDAVELGLVDRLGGLDDAIAAAAELAGAEGDRYRVEGLEAAPEPWELALWTWLGGPPRPVAALPPSLRAVCRAVLGGAGAASRSAARPPVLARLPFHLEVR